MSDVTSLPLIVLAGHDARPAVLPESGADKHPLVGLKGLDVRIGDQPLIDVLLERVQECGAFDPIYIAGSAHAYGERRGEARVLDTEGSFGHNIEISVAEVTRLHPDRPVALTTCDIVPEAHDLETAMADYAAVAPVDFWFPMITAPADPGELGASAWKPQYHVVPRPGEPPVSILPGHLLIVQPQVCRVPIVLRAFDLAYRTRNRAIGYRLVRIVAGVLGTLLAADLRGFFRLHPPTLTVSVIYNAVALGQALRGGQATPEALARHARAIFVQSRHRRRHPERGGRFTVLSAVSLAKDIDTEEEAAEVRRSVLRSRLRGFRRRRRGSSGSLPDPSRRGGQEV
ncbi:MAG: hypothetical protein ACRD2Z_15950 [Thermoanaerobaculia bacterium]